MAKTQNQLQISVSNGSFVDEGEGVISFPNGLTITDDSVMRSGTRYDINSLDVSQYGGQLTGDHKDSLGTLIGKVQGVIKEGNRVAIQGIKYAVKENPYARLAYDLLVGGFSNSFSIETIGPWPNEEDRTYYAHELVGLSQVVVPNNYNAKLNQFNEIVHNSLERSQQDGLDTSGIEETILSNVKFVKSEAVEEESMTKQKNDAPVKEETPVTEPTEVEEVKETEAVETEKVEEATPVVEETKVEETTEKEVEAPAETEVKVESEAVVRDTSGTAAPQPADGEELKQEVETTEAKEKAPEVKEQLEEVVNPETKAEEAPKSEEAPVVEPVEEAPEEEVENKTNKNEETLEMTAEQIAEIVANALKSEVASLKDELAATKELAQNALDTQAQAPAYVKEEEEEVKNAYDGLSSDEIFAKQLNAAVAVERMGSVEGRKVLSEINTRNLQALKDAKIVNAAMTLEDLGNFVIAPELYNQVVGIRTNYQGLVDATQWRETNSLEFSWLSRTSDIDMQPVAIGALGDVPSPDTTDNRLKPISIPTYGPNTDKMEEMAAVTPISINVIKFAAADILADVAEGYRNDYDRKRAQLVIARLQQAVNATGNKTTYDISNGIIQFAQAVAEMSDVTTVGSLIMNAKSLAMIKGAAIDANQESLLIEIGQGSVLGTPFVVVPNDLLPTLNSADTKTFVVQGQNVVIDQAVFYADLRSFTGRSSGGLKYDVDGSASYEIDGTVYSAYQRNEVVLRGSFFRGGVIKDPSVVSSIAATAVS